LVEIKPYAPSMFKDVLDMHLSQNTPVSEVGLPQIGFIAHLGEQPGAAGFLRTIEGGYVMIDNLVSNAALPPGDRHVCMTEVINTLIQTAKDLKFKGILCHTKDEGVLKRAAALGFAIVPQTVIALPL